MQWHGLQALLRHSKATSRQYSVAQKHHQLCTSHEGLKNIAPNPFELTAVEASLMEVKSIKVKGLNI
ncbi:MAG: hypothetical protein LLG04_17165 [Parachlamydia sp.]|nr:hypothetical protein [Parachlamydia sp.]